MPTQVSINCIPKNLAFLRKKINANQSFLAELFGISQNAWSLYENGSRSMKPDMIIRVAEHFNVSIDALMKKDISQIGLENARPNSKMDYVSFRELLHSKEELIQQLKSQITDKNTQIEYLLNHIEYLKSNKEQ